MSNHTSFWVWWLTIGVLGNVIAWFDGGKARALRGSPEIVAVLWTITALLGPINLAGALAYRMRPKK